MDFFHIPEAHVGAGHGRQTDGAGETLVTLGVIVLQTDLKLDGLEEVSLLLILRVVEQLLDILAHSGCGRRKALVTDTQNTAMTIRAETGEQRTDCDLGHDGDSLPKESVSKFLWCGSALNICKDKRRRKKGAGFRK